MAELREPGQRVSPRARTLWLVEALGEAAFTAVVYVVVVHVWSPFDVPWWVPTLIAVAAAAYVAVVPAWKYAVHRWEVTDTAVYTQTGWWSRERRIAPMSRIQTVDYRQGPLQRVFRIATVTVTTASAAGALQVAGLDDARARALVDELTLKADAEQGDAT